MINPRTAPALGGQSSPGKQAEGGAAVSTSNPLQELHKLGQSIWLDDIGKRMLGDGTLARLISEDGIPGVTSNPSILAHSITGDPLYAPAIKELLPKVSGSMALYEALAIDDLRGAADLF